MLPSFFFQDVCLPLNLTHSGLVQHFRRLRSHVWLNLGYLLLKSQNFILFIFMQVFFAGLEESLLGLIFSFQKAIFSYLNDHKLKNYLFFPFTVILLQGVTLIIVFSEVI